MSEVPHWTYNQQTGALTDPQGVVLEHGYSGAQPYVNVPRAAWREDKGPIPCGSYGIGVAYDHANLGPCSLPLQPEPTNTMFGRDAFFIHGDTQSMDHTASTGCIIMSRATRDAVSASDVRNLIVIR